MDIDSWIDVFFHAWKTHDVKRVLSLFSHDVEYWENPFYKLHDRLLLEKEWKVILTQSNIEIDYDVFLSHDNKYVVRWNLNYTEENLTHDLSGVYLIELNNEGLCIYFLQCFQEKPL